MSKAPRLGRASALAGLLSLVALACSSDIVELLPLTGGASNGGSGGAAGRDAVVGGASTGGANTGGRVMNQGGFAGGTQSNGGNASSGSAGCFGFGCANGGVGGSSTGPSCGNGMGSCTPCVSDAQCSFDQHCSAFLNNICAPCAVKGPSQCKPNYSCDVFVGRCAPSCVTTADCNDGKVCEPASGTCVSCIDNRECEQDGDPRTSVCYLPLRRCVECAQHSDCVKQGGEQRWCSGRQCVQCLSDKDCDPNGKSHCDVPQGHCE